MNLNLLDTLLFFGIIQAFVLAIIFLMKRKNLSYVFMAGILVILGLTTANTLLYHFISASLLNKDQLLIVKFLPTELIMLLGPFTYFYCRSVFEKNFKMTPAVTYHFIPVVIDLLPFIFSIVICYTSINELPLQNVWGTYIVIPQFLSLTYYLFRSWKYINKTKEIADFKTLKWVRNFLIGLSILDLTWFLYLPFFLSTSLQPILLETVYYYPLLIPVVAFLYFISIKLMASNLTFRPNLFSSDEIIEKIEHLHKVITSDRLYTHADLTLSQVSQKSNIPAKTISFILNHYLKKGFNEYINQYRVDAALDKIQNGEIYNLTVEGIGLEVGFSSRSTFYRSFKKATGQHPSYYLNGDQKLS